MPNTAQNLNDEHDAEDEFEEGIDAALRAAAGDYSDAALELMQALPARYHIRAARWLFEPGADCSRRQAAFVLAIVQPVSMVGRGKDRHEVEGTPVYKVEATGLCCQGVLGLAVDGAPYTLNDSNIWEEHDEASLSKEIYCLMDAIREASGIDLEILPKTLEAVTKVAYYNSRQSLPDLNNFILPFRDGICWERRLGGNPIRRAITAEDGVKRPVLMDAPASYDPAAAVNHDPITPWVEDEDDRDLLGRYVANTVCSRNSGKHIVVLEGLSNGGKGSFFDWCNAVFWGSHGTIRAGELDGRFELGRLTGVNVAVDADADQDVFQKPGSNMMKSITGNDLKQIEDKNKNGSRFKRFSLHCLLGANYPLMVADKGDAWLNRLIRIPIAIPKVRQAYFPEKHAEACRPWLASWLLAKSVIVWEELARPEANLRKTAAQIDAVKELTGPSDTAMIRRFISDICVPGGDEDYKDAASVKAAFERWGKANRVDPAFVKQCKSAVLGVMLAGGFSRHSKKGGVKAKFNPF